MYSFCCHRIPLTMSAQVAAEFIVDSAHASNRIRKSRHRVPTSCSVCRKKKIKVCIYIYIILNNSSSPIAMKEKGRFLSTLCGWHQSDQGLKNGIAHLHLYKHKCIVFYFRQSVLFTNLICSVIKPGHFAVLV